MTTETEGALEVYDVGEAPTPIAQQVPQATTSISPSSVLAIWREYYVLAETIQRTEVVPTTLRGRPDAILAVMLAGFEIGITPMQALSGIDIIEGKTAVSPELMRALVLAQGHTVILDASNDEASIQCRRKDWPAGEFRTFTWKMEDAQRVRDKNGKSLSEKPNWKNYPRAMLSARVTSEACRAIFPDVIKGLSYTPDEVQDWEPQLAGLSSAALPKASSPAAPTEKVAEFQVRVVALSDTAKNAMKAEWRDKGLSPLGKLTVDEIDAVEELITSYEEAPAPDTATAADDKPVEPRPADEPTPTPKPRARAKEHVADEPAPEAEATPKEAAKTTQEQTVLDPILEEMGWGTDEFLAIARYALGKPSFDGTTADVPAKDVKAIVEAVDAIMDGGLVLMADESGFKVMTAGPRGVEPQPKGGYGHSEEPFD